MQESVKEEITVKEMIWNLIDSESKKIVKEYSNYCYVSLNKKEEFFTYFDEYEKEIKESFMAPEVETLDSHKIAAIIICSILQTNIINLNSEIEENSIFLGNERIAVNIALNYMEHVLKVILKNSKELEKFSHYKMPVAFMCNVDYITIFCRNLYFAKTKYKLNPMDIANTLFLIETVSLLKDEIDLDEVKFLCENL